MDERLVRDEQGWWYLLRGGDRAGPFPDRASADKALEQFRLRCEMRFHLRPNLSALGAWATDLRSRRSA